MEVDVYNMLASLHQKVDKILEYLEEEIQEDEDSYPEDNTDEIEQTPTQAPEIEPPMRPKNVKRKE